MFPRKVGYKKKPETTTKIKPVFDYAWALNRTSRYRNIASNTNHGTPTNAPISPTKAGTAVVFPNTSGQAVDCDALDLTGLDELTAIVVIDNYQSEGTNEHFLLGNWGSSANMACFEMRIDPSIGDQLEMFMRDTTGGAVGGAFTDITPDSGPHVIAFRFKKGTGIHGWMDGKKSTISVTANNSFHGTVSDRDLWIGNSPASSTTDMFNGNILFSGISKRAFSDTELNYLTRDQNIWSIFESRTQLLPLTTGVAPTGRIMGSLANKGGLAGHGGIAGIGGGLA